jgi:hypothetical protein
MPLNMRLLNIKKIDGHVTEIHTVDNVYEIHNDADFSELIYDVSQKRIVLTWLYPSKWFIEKSNWLNNDRYLQQHDIKGKNQRKIALIFDLVSHLEIQPRDVEIPFTEDNCVSNIEIEEENGLIHNITFEFQSGMELSIISDTVTFDSDY